MNNEKQYEAFIYNWLKSLYTEIDFWVHYCKTHGGGWCTYEHFEKYFIKGEKREFVYPHLLEGKTEVDILDVGSAMNSRSGNYTENCKINYKCCDPLAPAYAQICEQFNLNLYAKPDFSCGEHLSDMYSPEQFDIVLMTNALDHVFFPMTVIREMLKVLKVGGTLYLLHNVNEAVREQYDGLHQWNIDQRGGHLAIWRQNQTINVEKELASYIEVINCQQVEGDEIASIPQVRWEIVKKANLPDVQEDIERKRAFNRAVLTHIMDFNSKAFRDMRSGQYV